MFDIGSILTRAWQILWKYKVLWILAFLLALTCGSGANFSGSGYRFSGNHRSLESFNNFQYQPEITRLENWFQQTFGSWFATEEKAVTTIFLIVLGVILLSILVGLLAALVRYPAEAAIIRMVDVYDQSGVKYGFKQGWKLGWTRRAFRMWVIDLLVSLPMILWALLFTALFAVVILSGFTNYDSTFSALALGLVCLLLPFILLQIFLTLVRHFVVRVAALENTTIAESFKLGWAMFKRNRKNAALMWLVMVGFGIAMAMGLAAAFFILIPAYAVMSIPAAIVAAIPGAVGYGITALINPQVWPWIIGALLALPFFFMIAFSPLIFVSGLCSLFSNNVWTLTYRRMKQMAEPPEVPAPVPSMSE